MPDRVADRVGLGATIALSNVIAARSAEAAAFVRAVAEEAQHMELPPEVLEQSRRVGKMRPSSDRDPELLSATVELLERLEDLHHRELLYRHRVRLALDPILGTDLDARQLSEPPPGPTHYDIPASDVRYPLLGREVRLPFGIPSSVLTSSAAWIEYFFDAGYNVITTRSLRSGRYTGYDPPNFFLMNDVPEQRWRTARIVAPPSPGSLSISHTHVSSVNSYGIPSDPVEWLPQIEKLASHERDGQLLIVSVVGQGSTDDEIVADFVTVGRMAAEAGARVIEANLSFLRRGGGRRYRPYCHDPKLTVRIMCALAEELSLRYNVSLVAKLSHMSQRRLKALAWALSPIVSGFSGINAVPVNVTDAKGAPYFPNRPTPPLLAGAAIQSKALDFVRTLAAVRARSRFRFDIIGIGGVMTIDDAIRMRLAGADAVLSSTGVTRDPYLGWDVAVNEDAFRAAR